MNSVENAVEENRRLRRTMQDLVSLSTLPAVWIGLGLDEVVCSLADSLLDTISLDLVLVRVPKLSGDGVIEVTRSKHSTHSGPLDPLSSSLARLLEIEQFGNPLTIADPHGNGTLHVAVTRFGESDDEGILITGSRDEDYPTEQDQLLLRVVTNQAAIFMQRQRAGEQLREREQQLRLVTDHAPILLVHCDQDARFKFVNRTYAQRFGLEPHDIIGKRIPEVIGKAAFESFREHVEKTLAGEYVEFETEIPYEHIGPRVMHCACAPDFGPDGKVRGLVAALADVTQRNRSEEALRQSEQRFARFMQHLPGLAWIKDAKGRYIFANEAAQKAFRATTEQLHGKTDEDIFPPATAAQFKQNDRLAVANGTGVQVIEELTDEDGTLRYSLVSKFPLLGSDGEVALVGGMAIDITERRRAMEEVRHSEERFRSLMEQAPFSIQVFSPDGETIRVNKAWEELWGVKFEQVKGYNILRDGQLKAKGVMPHIERAFAGEPSEIPAIEYNPNETIPDLAQHGDPRRWLSAVIYPIKDADGQVREVVLIHEDITARHRAETELRIRLEQLAESEQRFRQLADAMPQIVWTAGPDGQIEYMNRRWNEFTGLPASMGNEGWSHILHPEELKAAGERWAVSVRTGETFEMELRLLDRHTHSYRWHLLRTVAVRDDSGNVVRWFGTSTDIDEQKRAAEASGYLAEASAALAEVVDYESTLQRVANLAVPYFADWSTVDVVNSEGGLRRLAVAHLDPEKIAIVHQLMTEYPPAPDAPAGITAVIRTGKPEIIPDIPGELLVSDSMDERQSQLIQSLGLRSYICVPLVVSGTTFGALSFATAESGRRYTQADLTIAIDLAHRAAVAIENTQLYQALRDADRRKDEFLATLAHELRNPLAPIRNSLEILKMPRVDAELLSRSREMMERQVQQLVRLVDDLLDVSRVMRGKIELRREKIELATVAARAVETVQPLIDAQGHRLSVEMPTESLPVDADPIRLAQVIGNLLANAAKYTEPHGEILLAAERNGATVELRVRDTGIGIAPDMLPRIFDLFVQVDHASTKAQGGLGIGLTLVKNLVEMHHGSVEARSRGLGQGSEFIVRLPVSLDMLVDERSPSLWDFATLSPSPTGRRLLVVDDNEDAANSLAMLLMLQGHEVQVAFSGMSALEIVTNYSPDVVFLDIGMPDMDGYEVARRMRQQPSLKNVVLAALTGWGQQEDRRRTKEAGFDHHLVKPLTPSALEKVLVGA